MAVITGDFDPEIIRKFRGTLDYYYWRGKLVVRSWPRKPVLPRSPAVQQTARDFADTAKALSQLDTRLIERTKELVANTEWTWRDAWTTAAYNHGFVWDSETIPPPDEDVKYAIQRIISPEGTASVTLNVNSTSYVTVSPSAAFGFDFASLPATHFRIFAGGNSNQAGQTITMQLARRDAPTIPLSASGNDLVIPNTVNDYDSGWIPFDTLLTTWEYLTVAMKGSNSTVDYTNFFLEVHFKQEP